mmetsp:Transcript_61396/g.68694  ORF Transcript_61396/g.68694 Transcript_61396/m.68694 type:complete len:108 (-) Transcript_61396:628-951(-)
MTDQKRGTKNLLIVYRVASLLLRGIFHWYFLGDDNTHANNENAHANNNNNNDNNNNHQHPKHETMIGCKSIFRRCEYVYCMKIIIIQKEKQRVGKDDYSNFNVGLLG